MATGLVHGDVIGQLGQVVSPVGHARREGFPVVLSGVIGGELKQIGGLSVTLHCLLGGGLGGLDGGQQLRIILLRLEELEESGGELAGVDFGVEGQDPGEELIQDFGIGIQSLPLDAEQALHGGRLGLDLCFLVDHGSQVDQQVALIGGGGGSAGGEIGGEGALGVSVFAIEELGPAVGKGLVGLGENRDGGGPDGGLNLALAGGAKTVLGS